MMLPEHKEALALHRKAATKKPRPQFDEQHIEQLERMINDSIINDVELFLEIYGEYKDRDLRGKITRFDSQIKRIKIEWNDRDGEDEFEWISIYDIVDIFI